MTGARTPSGLGLDEITLDALRDGRIAAADLRATAETLRHQAAVARGAGREPLARNLERAAELSAVPHETILAIYTALRPHRSTAAQLEAWAGRLESEFDAPLSAAFVRDAVEAYAARGLLNERATV
jgi:propanediol dehydratase small subunit